MTAPAASAAPEPALYSTYELDVMLTLHDTEAGRASREQLGILGVPEEAEEFVTEAVMSGLRARDRLVHVGGKWVLGEEAQAVAGVLASADRWLGIALARGEAELDVEAEPMLVVGALPARSLHGYLEVRRYIGPDNEMGHTNMPTPKESPARIRQVVMSSKNSG